MTGRFIVNTTHPLLKEIFSEPIPVVFYEEEGECVAHALTTDILGYGEDYKEAANELVSLLKTHVIECINGQRPDLIWRTAPTEYWESYIEQKIKSKVKRIEELERQSVEEVVASPPSRRNVDVKEFKLKLPESRILRSWDRRAKEYQLA